MRSCEALAMVLAGGQGKRLLPLTLCRCKPAVAFAGSLRLIDLTLFNCFASDLASIHLLTQYRADPLERHISERWAPIALEQGRALSCLRSGRSYSGTADAVFQNLSVVERSGAEVVLILSADHIYRVDYRRLIELHLESGADITVLTDRVPAPQAFRYGVLSFDASGRLREFVEKPSPVGRSPNGELLNINLGVYCFSREAATDILGANAEEASHDFGKDILPRAVKSKSVMACPLERTAVDGRSYWRDVGTLESYFEASMELLCDPPAFELEDTRWREDSPFHDWLPGKFPNAQGSGTSLESANLIGRGAGLESADLVECIVSPGARVGKQARLERCILLPDAVVGPGASLSHVIVDEGARVPARSVLGGPRCFSGAGGITVVTGRQGEIWTSPLRSECPRA